MAHLQETPGADTAPAGRRILIVDDNRDAATSLAMLLELAGATIEVAHDGVRAVEVAAAFRPDVVLLDIGLPGLDGYEVACRLRGEPWGKGMTLVAITGWGESDDRKRSAQAGFDAHLVKPIDHAVLMQLLADAGPAEA